MIEHLNQSQPNYLSDHQPPPCTAYISVQTEADFAPPAGAGAPAHEIAEAPVGDEAPARDQGPCYTRSSGKITRVLPTLTDY